MQAEMTCDVMFQLLFINWNAGLFSKQGNHCSMTDQDSGPAQEATKGPLSCTSHHENFMSYSNIEFGPLHTWIKTCSRSWIPMNPHESPNRQVRLVHLPINCRSERDFLDSEMTRSTQHQQHLFERSVSLVSTIWYDLGQNCCCKPGYRCVVYSIIHHNSS